MDCVGGRSFDTWDSSADDTAACIAAAVFVGHLLLPGRARSYPWACRRGRVCSAQPADGGGYSSCRRGEYVDDSPYLEGLRSVGVGRAVVMRNSVARGSADVKELRRMRNRLLTRGTGRYRSGSNTVRPDAVASLVTRADRRGIGSGVMGKIGSEN